MKKSVVAIVGRPNVGKSTLFNRICRKRSAIVDFEEGVTRDRKYEEAEWTGHKFIIVDTGGIIPKSDHDIDKAVKFQAEVAIDEADLILFVVDAKTGATDIDKEISSILLPKKEKVFLVVNKVDNEKDELEIYDTALTQAEIVYVAYGPSSQVVQSIEPLYTKTDLTDSGDVSFADFAVLVSEWLDE